MIHTSIERNGRIFVVGNYEDANEAFDSCERMATNKGWRVIYKKHFENVDDPEEDEYLKI
jgi:hypothetical protein